MVAAVRRLPETLADLLGQLGDVPSSRVLLQPRFGMATEADAIRINEGHDAGEPGRIVELINGYLVEKSMGFRESLLAVYIATCLRNYCDQHDAGIVTGPDGMIRLKRGLVRVPDVCFLSWDAIGADEVAADPISDVIPELAVEVLSPGNTAREMDVKIDDYFTAGVSVVWVVDPKAETATAYTSRKRSKTVDRSGVLEAPKILPGFRLPLDDLFSSTRRKKRNTPR
jgi:Uma2 family endonuclease